MVIPKRLTAFCVGSMHTGRMPCSALFFFVSYCYSLFSLPLHCDDDVFLPPLNSLRVKICPFHPRDSPFVISCCLVFNFLLLGALIKAQPFGIPPLFSNMYDVCAVPRSVFPDIVFFGDCEVPPSPWSLCSGSISCLLPCSSFCQPPSVQKYSFSFSDVRLCFDPDADLSPPPCRSHDGRFFTNSF